MAQVLSDDTPQRPCQARCLYDQWLELKTSDGFRAAQLDYWIKGKRRTERRPRWNLLDALLTPPHG